MLSMNLPGGIKSHILDQLLGVFGGHMDRKPDEIEGHSNRMQEEDPEDFGAETKPTGINPSAKPGDKTSELTHPRLQMLMAKLSPTQEEEPEEDSQFSPGRMESDLS